MCARYTTTRVSADELRAEFELDAAPPPLTPHFNLAPTMDAPVVIAGKSGGRHLGLARFGLVPHWAKDLSVGARMLNARAESVADKPAFRDALARHRCLVVADGFYEWKHEGKLKVPHYFHLPDGRPFGFAGLWAVWRDAEGKRVTSFTILTRDAEGVVAPYHDRMPVILTPDVYSAWLDREVTEKDLALELLDHHRTFELSEHRVSQRVNSVKNDDPSLIEAVADEG